MNESYHSANAVLAVIRAKLASKHTSKPADVLNEIVATLAEARNYRWLGIYLGTAEFGMLQSCKGSAPARVEIGLADVKAEIAIPVKLGVRTLGLIVAETGRPANFARQERTLLQQVAKLLAQYFTSDRAKGLLRKAREEMRAAAKAVHPHKRPQSARPAVRQAAAGERSSH